MKGIRIRWIMQAVMVIVPVFLAFFLFVHFVDTRSYSGANFSQASEKIEIYLDKDHIIADQQESFERNGSQLIITQAGVYQISGSLDNGQIIVDAGAEDEVELQLKGVNIHCEDSAAIFVKAADKVILKLKKGSQNILSDGEIYAAVADGELEPKGCITSRSDLTIKGAKGELHVKGNAKHGIACSDDLKIKSGEITVSAHNIALKGKDSVTILDGKLNLTGKDGIYSSGPVSLEGGHVQIHSRQYGVFGSQDVTRMEDCQLEIDGAVSPVAGFGAMQGCEKLVIEKE